MKTYQFEVLRFCILNSRASLNKNILDQYQNIKAGFSGEEKATSYLSEASLTPKVSVYRHIYLDETQFDLILVTPKLICILEVKNMTGEFYFDPVIKQFYVIKDGKKEGRRNPELQLQRAVKILRRNLNKKGIDFPVHGLIIFVSRKGIVVQPPTLFQAVPIDAMCDTLEKLEESSTYRMTNDQLNKTRHFFKRQRHKVQDEDIFSHAGISESSITTGVRCNECFKLGMIRIYSTWLCTKCNHQDKKGTFPYTTRISDDIWIRSYI